ncbi:MAG: c-type cytochrome domain-containing protein, partial [Akkermansiaceae bacterium]
MPANPQQFFENHCIGCHGPKKAKGSIRLDHLDGRISQGQDFETWNEIYDQLAQRGMPPEEAKHQPDEAQRASITSWLSKELEKARSSPRGRHLLGQFSFGNQVHHDALFSGEIKELPFSPPRLWRINPNIYDRTKKRIFKDHWMELRKARQPFPLEQRPG